MFNNILALTKSVEKLVNLDSQCKTITDEINDLIPELEKNVNHLQATKDQIKEASEALSSMLGDDVTEPHIEPAQNIEPDIEQAHDHEQYATSTDNLDSLDNWITLAAAKMNKLIDQGSEQAAKKLEPIFSEIGEKLYGDDGHLIKRDHNELGLSSQAKRVWESAVKTSIVFDIEVEDKSEEISQEMEDMLNDLDVDLPTHNDKDLDDFLSELDEAA